MCGRYGISLAEAWSLTPAEFEELISGCVERERVQRLIGASIQSAIIAFGGSRVSPLTLIGEEDPTTSYDALSPFGPADPLVMRDKMKARLEEQHRAAYEAWVPFDDEDDAEDVSAVLDDDVFANLVLEEDQ